jgi:hypothetical protein
MFLTTNQTAGNILKLVINFRFRYSINTIRLGTCLYIYTCIIFGELSTTATLNLSNEIVSTIRN